VTPPSVVSGDTINLTVTEEVTEVSVFGGLLPNILSAKGDLLTHDGTDFARQPAGTDGYLLSYDSTQTTGLKAIAPSGGLVETGSYSSPQLITTTIAIPTDMRSRVYVKGSSGAVVNPTLGSGSSTKEMHLFGASDTNTVELNTASNLILSGKIILKDKTQLCLHWIAGLNKWVEAFRNEI